MIRCPLLPVTSYGSSEKTSSVLNAWSEQAELREAVAVSSPSLASMIGEALRASGRPLEKVSATLLRYLIRMSTRPTPYGLCAGVALGSFGLESGVALAPRAQWRKRTRPDFEWLIGLVNRLEGRPEIRKQLRVFWNPAVVGAGDRFNLCYRSSNGGGASAAGMDAVSIRRTPAVETVLDLAKEPLRFTDLLDAVAQAFPGVTADQVSAFLTQLFRQEFLLSLLRPPAAMADPLQYVIEQVSTLPEAQAEHAALLALRNLLQAYDRTPVGQGEKLLADLHQLSRSIFAVDNPVQVDLALQIDQGSLNCQVAAEVERAADLLWRLSPARSGLQHLEAYRAEFLERYGENRLVPVLELIDEDSGLGPPPSYQYPPRRARYQHIPDLEDRRDHVLLEIASKALVDGAPEVELTAAHVEQLISDSPSQEPPLSMELNFMLAARSAEAIDRGDYWLVIGPNFGSYGAGKTFGRFADLLGSDAHSYLKQLHETEKQLDPDGVTAEISFLPPRARLANVAHAPCVREYEIALACPPSGESPALPLSDLFVGIRRGRLFLWSATLNKEVRVTTGHMLNTLGGPNLYRFLRELAEEGYKGWQPWTWGRLDTMPVLPRVRSGRIVLSVAQWNLNLRLLGITKADLASNNLFSRALARWRTTWTVPRHVYLTVSDNRLLLDLENEAHVAEVRDALKAAPHQVVLQEMLPDFDHHWVISDQGPHAVELVFPLTRRAQSSRKVPSSAVRRPAPRAERVQTPGSEWLYLKLYHAVSREEEFLVNHLSAHAEDLRRRSLCYDWFFIRFLERAPHVRLRFRGDPAVLIHEALPVTSSWARSLQEQGMLREFSVATYEREVERYGGGEAIGGAERLFAADSRTAIHLLRELRSGETGLESVPMAAVNLVALLDQLGITRDEQVAWFRDNGVTREFGTDYRPWRTRLMNAVPVDGCWQRAQSAQMQPTFEALGLRTEAARAYGQLITSLERQGRLSSTRSEIIGSLTHMLCNRFLGLDRLGERKALAFASYTVYSLLQRAGGRSHA
ncbi:MAG: lantibiotic dehydratase [Bacillota bacterium]